MFIRATLLLILAVCLHTTQAGPGKLYPNLDNYVHDLVENYADMSFGRKETIKELAKYIYKKQQDGQTVDILFLGPFNARLSQMAEIWATAAAYYYKIGGVNFYSAGADTEGFAKQAIFAMEKAGFIVYQLDDRSNNPKYEFRFGYDAKPLIVRPKKTDYDKLPKRDFAIVPCTEEAARIFPHMKGANFRLPLGYENPRSFENTDRESQGYQEVCEKMGTEMFYLFYLLHLKEKPGE